MKLRKEKRKVNTSSYISANDNNRKREGKIIQEQISDVYNEGTIDQEISEERL